MSGDWKRDRRSGFYRQGHDLIWVRFPPDIQMVAHNAEVDQEAFAFGDPGTESGHAIDTLNTDRTVAGSGAGDYDFFLRFEVEQTVPNADADLTWAFRLQRQINTGGWGTCPTAAGAGVKVHIYDDSNITHGADTTDRVSSSGETFLTDNNGVADTSADTNALTWTASARGHAELLYALRITDAEAVAGDVFDFRIVRDDDTLLNTYTVADATLNWNAGGGDDDLLAAATHVPPNTLLRM